MAWTELLFGWLLVAVLLGLGVFIGWRQLRLLRVLRVATLPDEEMTFEHHRARRRLFSCAMLLVLGTLLTVLLAVYEPAAGAMAEERARFEVGQAPELTDEQRMFLRIWIGGWILFLLGLLVVVGLAGLDLMTTRRYGLREYRKIQADRRAMIQRQVTRIRQERNGDPS